ncbi:hypothetical protein BRD08_10510 [Halobacteriales archaeon SW_10_66_29]|nr:MAG: hypothetical protein BRD08_10510 [Halobacteriales archaeon SW_10_66_29]
MVTPDGERGQLILVGALLVAATILGSIALLNSIHESPDVNTKQDAQSLAETERTIDQVQTGLERAFLVNTSMDEVNESLPYANQTGGFDTLVEEAYVREYLNLSTTETAGVLNVTVVGNQTGGIARQNTTVAGFEDYPSGPVDVVEGAAAVPRFYLLVNDTSSSPFIIQISETGPTFNSMQLEISNSEVAKRGFGTDWTCDLSGDDSTIEIDFVNGEGEVRTDETYCGNLNFGPPLDPDYTIQFQDGGNADGTYTITAVDPTDVEDFPEDFRWSRDGTVVNPIFGIEYRTPNVAYNTTYGLYNGTGS